ncbi:hypothetical protein [Streptomyces fragilis]|uniref:hypothetical protein n=1 Tax=Streptomyces fragilis TaxID=67301 RepID=UPI003557A246
MRLPHGAGDGRAAPAQAGRHGAGDGREVLAGAGPGDGRPVFPSPRETGGPPGAGRGTATPVDAGAAAGAGASLGQGFAVPAPHGVRGVRPVVLKGAEVTVAHGGPRAARAAETSPRPASRWVREPTPPRPVARYLPPPAPECVLTRDGTYAARLTLAADGESWLPERWALGGPEPYVVPLPGNQPEEPDAEVQPMSDGRVLIHRTAGLRHTFSLLYPTGPGTGELSVGSVECPDGESLRLLPPAPDGRRAYAVAVSPGGSTAVWLVAGGSCGPEHLGEVRGHCSGGVWLDHEGRMLALDRAAGGRTKTVVVDLARGCEVSPLLQISAESDDRLVTADPDSGLLLIRSDAPSPGRHRLGWGVLGSTLPVRFPEGLCPAECVMTPFAVQPGQVLTPEACSVALRVDGVGGSWIGLWRPADRRVTHVAAPAGWLIGAGRFDAGGELRLPYAAGEEPCGLATVLAPPADVADSASVPVRPVPLQQSPLATV